MSSSLTAERLRHHLNARQSDRERLAVAVLALNKQFTSVRGSHPEGGPDGGADIFAIFNGHLPAIGAVGFVNDANDLPKQKKQIREKFGADLSSAKKLEPALSVFVFITNIRLSNAEKRTLKNLAAKEGIAECIIFDRETVRQELDSPSGLAARYQYLDIALSPEEQRTFFETWGDRIQESITNSIGQIEASLSRIEFHNALSRPLRRLAFTIELDDKAVGDLDGFVAAMLISPQAILFRENHPLISKFHTLFMCVRSNCRPLPEYPNEGSQESGLFRSPQRRLDMKSTGILRLDSTHIVCDLGYTPGGSDESTPYLRDLDETYTIFLVSQDLAKCLKRIRIFANDFLLGSYGPEDISLEDCKDSTLEKLMAENGQPTQIVKIRPAKGSCFSLDFAQKVPLRRFLPGVVRDSAPPQRNQPRKIQRKAK